MILKVYIPELSPQSFGEREIYTLSKAEGPDSLRVNNRPYYAASNWAKQGRTSQLAGHLTCPRQVLWPAHIALVPPGENSSFHSPKCLIYSRLWIEWACWLGTGSIPLAQPQDMIIHARVRQDLPADPVQSSPRALNKSDKRLLECHILLILLLWLIRYWHILVLLSKPDFLETWSQKVFQCNELLDERH